MNLVAKLTPLLGGTKPTSSLQILRELSLNLTFSPLKRLSLVFLKILIKEDKFTDSLSSKIVTKVKVLVKGT